MTYPIEIPDKSAAEILEMLAGMRDRYQEQEHRHAGNPVAQMRSSLATSIFNAASKVKPEVLQEIFRFHEQLAGHNKMALSIDSPIDKDAFANTSLTAFAKNLADHIDRDAVDPKLMPWQYRK